MRQHKPRSPLDKAKGYEVVWNQVSGLFDAARPVTDCCFVYLIGEADDGPVKIGVSKDPIARLRTMQTGNPRRLRVEQVLVGDAAIEKLLHEIWELHAVISSRNAGKPDRAPGTEWFTPEVRAALLPVIATAAAAQAAYLRQPDLETVDLADLERIVREAHDLHGVEMRRRHEVRVLASGAGYALASRKSRI